MHNTLWSEGLFVSVKVQKFIAIAIGGEIWPPGHLSEVGRGQSSANHCKSSSSGYENSAMQTNELLQEFFLQSANLILLAA